jgi:hypothetical protein
MPNDARTSLTAVAARPRVRRAIAWLVGILVAFSAIGFLVLPLVVKPVLEHALSSALARKVTIERVAINPYALSVTLADVAIGERGEGPPLLTLSELYANAETASVFRWAPVVSALKLTRPTLHLVRNADQSYNVSDLVEQALAGPPGPPPRFSISNIEVVDGRVDFDDRPDRRQHQLTQLELGIPFLSSLPTQTEIKVEPFFSALLNGRRVAVTGETRPFKDTHETMLHWEMSGVPLPTYVDYAPITLPVKLPSGSLDAEISLSFIARGRDPPQLSIAGTARLADLVLTDRAGRPLLRAPFLSIALDRLDPLGGNAELRSIVADGMQLELLRAQTGELNLATLVSAKTPTASPGAPFRFHIGNLALTHGTVRVTDQAVTPAYVATLNDVAAAVTNLASAGEQKATVTASFTTDAGERVTHHGALALSPLLAEGRLEVTGLKLQRLFPYYAGALNLAVDDGALDLATDVRFNAAGPAAGLTFANLAATVSELKMRLPDDKEQLWRVPMLAVRGGSVDVDKRVIHFDSVEGRGAAALIRRATDGRINFARLIRTPEGGAKAGSSEETWRVEATKVALDDFSATFIDQTVTPPARIALSRVAVAAENLSNGAKAGGRVSVQATVNKRGTVSMTGPLTTAPLVAKLNVTTRNIDLVPFQPYITQSARVVFTGGAASAKGTLDFATGTAARTAFKGELVLQDVAALDETNDTDLLKWKSLTLGGIDAQLEPLAVSVGDITLADFYARLILNDNGEFNLQQLARGTAPAASPSPTQIDSTKTVELATPPTAATTWLKLGKTTLTSGTIYFTDHFVRPNYSANLTALTGSLSTLAFDQPADIELRGKVQETAPVEIVGRINPLAQNLFLDLKAEATDIELPPLSPYSGKYVGYGIEKGKLSMKVKYLIDDRKLTAENSIVLNQLTFGNKVDSPDATKLPVLLAVALLKDRNGVINIDLPVGGSLDDPQFSVGGIVFRALMNLIAKIVTSPFALLGSLAGGHGEELAYVEFAPGSAILDPAGDGKVQSIAKALTDRPAVKLDIAGRIDPAGDREGLKRVALDHKIRLQKFNDLVKLGEPPVSVDAVQVDASEYEALLQRVYKAEDFPKPRNAIGLAKDLPREEMETLILTHTSVHDDDLRLLAEHRAQVVRNSLVDKAHIPPDRVFLVAPKLDAEGIKDKGKATRVDFALR